MSKCFFSDRDADVVALTNRDGVSISVEPFGKYWVTGQVIKIYSGNHTLSSFSKLNCLRETINLNREGLIPFWTSQKEGETLPDNAKVVLRSIEAVKTRSVDHKDKEKKILDLLSRKLENSLNPFELTFLDLRP